MAATSAPGGAAPQNQSAAPDRRRWLILTLIGLAQLMIVLDGSVRVHISTAEASDRL